MDTAFQCDVFGPVNIFLINLMVGLSMLSTIGLFTYIISITLCGVKEKIIEKSMQEQFGEMPMMKNLEGILGAMSKGVNKRR